MAKNKETSARETEKFSVGSHGALVRDIQDVHQLFNQLFPTEVLDIDFYRKHGEYTDDAWKMYFPRFEDFVAQAEVTPATTILWHLSKAFRLLQQDFTDEEYRELDEAFDRAYVQLGFRRKLEAAFAELREELGIKGSGDEQAT